MGPTTDAMVIAAQDAVAHADEAVEAAAVLLAEAVVEAWEDVHAHVANYRRGQGPAGLRRRGARSRHPRPRPGGARMIETPEYADMLCRMVRAYGRRVGDGDPVDLARMVEVKRELDQAILGAVRGQREAGFSWREVAEGLGTTRQAAQITYGRRAREGGDCGAA
jgi:hypothetical protein